jgi:hypothetical protein
MTLTKRQWTSVIVISTVLFITLMILGGDYHPLRSLGMLMCPVGLWINLRRDPAQRQIRPAIRVLGWILFCVCAVTFVTSILVLVMSR